MALTLGLRDQPDAQTQPPYLLPLSDVGNAVIYGGPGSGKTSALITVVCAAIRANPATQVYGIDAAGGRLFALAVLPNIGEIIGADDRDRVLRLLGLVKTTIADRQRDRGASPPVVLLLDGIGAFRDAYDHVSGGTDPFGDLVEIAAQGRAVGVHIVLTSERAAILPAALAASIPERLSLRLASSNDSATLGVPANVLEDAPPGRAIHMPSGDELQLGLPGSSADPADIDAALTVLAAQQEQAGIERPRGVPAIPMRIARNELLQSAGVHTAIAIDTIHLRPVAAPSDGLLLVTGPAGSGRTTAIRSLLAAFHDEAAAGHAGVDCALISARRSSLRDACDWWGAADDADGREDLISNLTRALGGIAQKQTGLEMLPLVGSDPAPGAATPVAAPEPPPVVFPRPGRRGVVVIEDIGAFDGSGNEPQLATLLKLLRRSDLTTIVEGENATLGAVWERTLGLSPKT